MNWLARLEVDPTGPIHLAESVGGNELSVGCLEHVKEPAAVCLHDNPGRLASDIQRAEDWCVHAVVVERVIRRHLECPCALARLGLQRDNGVRPEIVALAALWIPGRWIACAPEYQVEIGIIGTGHPARAAADETRVPRPSLRPLLFWSRNIVVAPQMLAGLCFVALD